MVRCGSSLQRDTEILVCDIFLNFFVWLHNAGELCLSSLALERDVECGVHVVDVDADADEMFVR